jgi:hypothetical protein
MDNQQIEQLIDREAARRSAADREHLERLSSELTADLGAWAFRRRLVGSLLALVLLVGLPMAYHVLLPSRHDALLVACNLDGQEEAVLHCANIILT